MSIAEHLENTDKQKVKKKKFKYPVTSVSEIVFWYIPSQFIFLYIYFPVYSHSMSSIYCVSEYIDTQRQWNVAL